MNLDYNREKTKAQPSSSPYSGWRWSYSHVKHFGSHVCLLSAVYRPRKRRVSAIISYQASRKACSSTSIVTMVRACLPSPHSALRTQPPPTLPARVVTPSRARCCNWCNVLTCFASEVLNQYWSINNSIIVLILSIVFLRLELARSGEKGGASNRSFFLLLDTLFHAVRGPDFLFFHNVLGYWHSRYTNVRWQMKY